MKLNNLSIMSIDVDHVEEICADVIEQQKQGVSSVAMFMMFFAPEGTPTVQKAEIQCKNFDLFRERLDKAGAKYGVLVQSTMGHIAKPATPHVFQTTVSVLDGAQRESTCCPLDENFKNYLKEQMKILATRNPSIIMLDDDLGTLYRANLRGCACPLHLSEFNRRAGTNFTREQLYEKLTSGTEEGKRYEQIFARLQGDAIVDLVKAMREGIDEVNPSIQGAVSGILGNYWLEFSNETAEAFKGKGNKKMIRLNGGIYCSDTLKWFSMSKARASHMMHYAGKEDTIFLAETDTCPHNRYATPASKLNAHYTSLLLEGAKGAKHWLTRSTFELESGKAYRKILSKYSKFHQAVADLYDELKPVGARIPLFGKIDYGFSSKYKGVHPFPWSSCILERLGLPVYFSAEQGGAVFVDDYLPERLTDEEIAPIFKGTVVMTAEAANTLKAKGYGKYIGVSARAWQGKSIGTEYINGIRCAVPANRQELVIEDEKVKVLSYVYHTGMGKAPEKLFPAVTSFENELGGITYVFCGTPDTHFNYYDGAFAFLNQTRKAQLVDMLKSQNNLPVYYPEDGDLYMRAGYLNSGELMVALFNTSLDVVENVPLVFDKEVTSIERLMPDGTRKVVDFTVENGVVRLGFDQGVYEPLIIFAK